MNADDRCGERRPRDPAARRRRAGRRPDAGASSPTVSTPATEPPTTPPPEEPSVDLAQRRDELTARFAELQCDLGGLVYEMAIRNHIRVDVLVRRAAILQDVDAELERGRAHPAHGGDGHRGLVRVLRRAAQQRRRLLLAVRSAAARARPERRDQRSLSSLADAQLARAQPKRPVT